MRRDAHHLEHATDRAALHEFAREDRALDVQPLAEIHEVFAAGGGDHRAGLGELVERGERGLVGEVVLAGAHDPATEWTAFGRDGGGGHEFHVGVVENLVERARGTDAGILRLEGGDALRIGIVDPFQLAAGFEEPVALSVNVAVVEVGGGKDKLAAFHHGIGFALGGVGHAVVAGFHEAGTVSFAARRAEAPERRSHIVKPRRSRAGARAANARLAA
jgi:hypothetical protein